MIGIHDPYLSEAESAQVNDALRSNWLSGGGEKVRAFEGELQKFFALPHPPVATVNGSGALILALRALGVGAGDHVLVSEYGFVATANAVRIVGAEPVFLGADDPEHPVVSFPAVEKFLHRGPPVRAMLYNEPFGFACPRLAEIAALLKKHAIPLVEDASQAIGVKPLGTVGTLAALSFNGNKTITTGAGGALLGSDPALLARARKLQHQSRSDDFEFFYDELGYNFLLSNVLGAIGLAQAQRLPEILERKRRVRAAYARLLKGTELVLAGPEAMPAWLNVVLLPPASSDRARVRKLAEGMKLDGVQIRPTFPPVTDYPMYRSSPRFGGDAGRSFYERGICLPSGAGVTDEQVSTVVQSLLKHL